jgi:uncharacterized protein (TIGR02466 family)
MKVENIFPTPIGLFEYTGQYDQAFLMAQPQKDNVYNTSSVDTYILRRPEIANLTAFIESCVQEYFQEIFSPRDNVQIKLTQSWLNWTKPSQYHHRHTHSNSLISGCFYVSADKETDRIYFYSDAYKRIKVAPKVSNAYNSNSWCCAVGSGNLILFPSELEHMVQPVTGEGTRVSIAFNAFPIGLLGDEREMTVLHVDVPSV